MKLILLLLATQACFSFTKESFESSVAIFVKPLYEELGLLPQGSGFFIDDNGAIATNYHVIEGRGNRIIVRTHDNKYHISHTLRTYQNRDLAIIRIPSRDYKGVKFSQKFEMGESVYTFGNYVTKSHVYSKLYIGATGVYLSPRKDTYYGNLIQFNGAINAGTSGAGIFNEMGRVIGVATLSSSEYEIVGYAINAGILLRLIDSSNDLEDRDLPFGQETNPLILPHIGTSRPYVPGVLVLTNYQTLKKGDIIVKFNEVQVTSKQELASVYQSVLPDSVPVEIVRGRQMLSVNLSF